MELLYVWIGKFRNIENKGFNLSVSYNIKYNIDNNNVVINDLNGDNPIKYQEEKNLFKKEKYYLDNFFEGNIVNITALIGKNSTGKSNILDFILTAIQKGNRNEISNSNYFFLIRDGEELKFFGTVEGKNINDSKLLLENRDIEKVETDKNWFSIFFSNVSDNRDYVFENSVSFNFSYRANNKLQGNKIAYVSSDEFDSTWEQLWSKSDIERTIHFQFNPKAYNTLITQKDLGKKVEGVLERYRKAIYTESTSNYNRFKYSFKINLFSFFVSENFLNEEDLDNIELSASGMAENIAKLDPKILKLLKGVDLKKGNSNNFSKNDLKIFLNLINELEVKPLDLGKVKKNSSYIIVDFNTDFKKMIKENVSVFNKADIISHDWGKLSSGMKAYLALFSQLYSAKEKVNSSKERSLLLCIDEGDLYMHPEWQRTFLKDLISFVNKTFQSKKIQIVLTSHSPFLISDLPKESVVLLEENGVLNRQLFEKSSFGANIHQLFSHQFFLREKGTIGAYAEKKIKETILEIENFKSENSNSIQRKIDMIGEPIIKKRVQQLLNTKIRTMNKEVQIKWHSERIEELKKKE